MIALLFFDEDGTMIRRVLFWYTHQADTYREKYGTEVRGAHHWEVWSAYNMLKEGVM
jgi:hypothetical protein